MEWITASLYRCQQQKLYFTSVRFFFVVVHTLPYLLYCSSATRNRNVYVANSGVAVFITLLLPAVGPISYPRIRCKKVSNGTNGCRLHRTFRSQCCRCRST